MFLRFFPLCIQMDAKGGLYGNFAGNELADGGRAYVGTFTLTSVPDDKEGADDITDGVSDEALAIQLERAQKQLEALTKPQAPMPAKAVYARGKAIAPPKPVARPRAASVDSDEEERHELSAKVESLQRQIARRRDRALQRRLEDPLTQLEQADASEGTGLAGKAHWKRYFSEGFGDMYHSDESTRWPAELLGQWQHNPMMAPSSSGDDRTVNSGHYYYDS